MKAAWVLVAVAGCAPARPEKLERPHRKPHRVEEPVGQLPAPRLAPAPAIDRSVFAVDFHDELRWPLTPMNHPVMEPKFPIAQAFAQPGVGWTDLCSSGITNRYGGDKELLSYLRGWCKAVEGDTDAACTNLAPLMHSTKPHLDAAVRNDLANILAQGHADKAEHFIRVHELRDVGMLDLLAANFVEVGTTDDALTINRNAIDSDDFATAATRCMRWTRQIVLLDDKLSPLLKQVEAFANAPKNPDPTCAAEYAKLTCWAQHACSTLLASRGASALDIELVSIIDNWDWDRLPDMWWTIAGKAAMLLASPHSSVLDDSQLAELATAAMENATRLEFALDGNCFKNSAISIDKYAKVLLPYAGRELADRLRALAATCAH